MATGVEMREVILESPDPPFLDLLDSGGGLRSREETETASEQMEASLSRFTTRFRLR